MFRQLRALPNQLTLLRLTIVPFLVLAIFDANYHRAFVLIVIAGVSDGLDGTLARLFRQRTQLGSYLDPIADKLMLSTLFLVLMHVGLVPRRVTVMVFSRDLGILVVGTLLFATTGTRDFRPSFLGKANTIAQIFAVCSVVLAQTDPDAWVLWIRHTSLEATFWLTLSSGFHYLWRCRQRFSVPADSAAGGFALRRSPQIESSDSAPSLSRAELAGSDGAEADGFDPYAPEDLGDSLTAQGPRKVRSGS